MSLSRISENHFSFNYSDGFFTLCSLATSEQFMKYIQEKHLQKIPDVEFLTIIYNNLTIHGIIEPENYFTLKSIFFDGGFDKLFRNFIYTQDFSEKDFSGEDLSQAIFATQKHINETFLRFQIFELIESEEAGTLDSYSVVYSEDNNGNHIQIIAWEENRDIILVIDGIIMPMYYCLLNQENQASYFTFHYYNFTFIYDIKGKELRKIAGTYERMIQKESMTWIITSSDILESLTILGDSIYSICLPLPKNSGSSFLDIIPGKNTAYAVCKSISVSVSNENQDEDVPLIRRQPSESLIDMQTWKCIFTDTVEVYDVVTTSDDTYIIVEKYSSENLHLSHHQNHPENDEIWYTFTALYSLNEEEYLPITLLEWSRPKFISTPENLLVYSLDREGKEGLYSCKDGFWMHDIQLHNIVIDGDEKLFYMTWEGEGNCVFHSSKGMTYSQEGEIQHLLYSDETLN